MNSYNSYKFEGGSGVGVGAFLAVVAGAAQGDCMLPGGANAKGFVGFTSDSLTAAQCAYATLPVIPVVRGRCRAIAAGTITHGHWVQIGAATGTVADCQAAVDAAPGVAAEVNVIGKAETDATVGQYVVVTTQEFVVQIAVS
jgi:hypothetical protein